MYLRSVRQSSVDLADILKTASHGLMIKSGANTKTEASAFDVRRTLIFCLLHPAMSENVCGVTWQPIAETHILEVTGICAVLSEAVWMFS